ncbi:MAG: hypothetical protein PHY12_06890 [Eubacteriales bacterium]|nr:hypothetical protein [Eubacteriales bacterium]
MATKTSAALSLPKARKVRGYTIERMPIGRFLQAMQTLQEAPETLTRALFPDSDARDVMAQLGKLNRESLQALAVRALGVVPGFAVRLFAELSGIEEEKLLADPDVGLDGLAEMLDAWLDVNGIENFMKAAGALWDKVRKTSGGSKG